MATLADDRLLTREDAADLLSIRPQTLALWASTKRYDLPYVKVGRAVRYRLSDIEQFLKSRTVNADDA